MEHIKSVPIVTDKGFKKEIGVDIDKAVEILGDNGVTKEDMTKIIEKFGEMSDEIDRRNIPYECRFLLLNVIFYTLFKTNHADREKFAMIIKDMEDKRSA